MSVSQDERERAVFRSRRMYQTDLQSNYATVKDEGRMEEKLAIARNLLGIHLPLEQIAAVTGLSRAEIEALRTPQ